jgi:hypothetical protein
MPRGGGVEGNPEKWAAGEGGGAKGKRKEWWNKINGRQGRGAKARNDN